jgi:putative signal transducing protein
MEAGQDWRSPAYCQHFVDNPIHTHMEALMDELTWEILTEVQGRLEAEFIKSYLEAHGIEVELFQESVGHHIYPVTIDGLGRVQIFVPKDQAAEARQLLEEYNNAKK